MFKPKYWLHVNHPNNKARIHKENGCASVRRAIDRIRAGAPYGPIRKDKNGYWEGPFAAIHDAEVAQKATKKTIQDKCRICFSQATLSTNSEVERKQKQTMGGTAASLVWPSKEDSADQFSPEHACATLHDFLGHLPVFDGTATGDFPAGCGIYFFYEDAGGAQELSSHKAGSLGIVRVGISSGTGMRISHHYHGVIPIEDITLDTLCPKDRSVMRKHIGRALLNSPGHPCADYLKLWNVDLTKSAERQRFRSQRRIDAEKAVEREVSEVLQRTFRFRYVVAATTEIADQWETQCIGILASCSTCCRSSVWLGRHHPDPVISLGKLWNVRKVNESYRGPLPFDRLTEHREIKSLESLLPRDALKLVITCAGHKREPISFDNEGSRVEFVAQPHLAPRDPKVVYFRPDDSAPGTNATWRGILEDYNLCKQNERGFWASFKLYQPPKPYSDIYERLKGFADRRGHELFILSAGWGLVQSDYWLPHYQITFTRKTDKLYTFRSSADCYQDFQQLTNPDSVPIIIFAGKSYRKTLFDLLHGVAGRKLVFWLHGAVIPEQEGYEFLPYVPPDHIRDLKTNWQYECAKDFIEHPRVREWALTAKDERIIGPDIEKLWKDLRSSSSYS
jgi:Family of unknown function (DUF6884)